MTTETTTPGQRIRAARIAAGLTGSELAQRLGVGQPRVSNLESGQRSPSLKMLLRIAEALGCDPHQFDPSLAQRKSSP